MAVVAVGHGIERRRGQDDFAKAEMLAVLAAHLRIGDHAAEIQALRIEGDEHAVRVRAVRRGALSRLACTGTRDRSRRRRRARGTNVPPAPRAVRPT